MVARHLLFKRQDDAVEKIAAHAQSIGGQDKDVVEAVEAIRNVRGMDEQHIRVFRTEAVANLMEVLDKQITGSAADPLEASTVPELKGIAKREGVQNYSDMNKSELIHAINASRRSDSEE